MPSYTRHAHHMGAMYLLAMVASIAGGMMIQSVLLQTPLLTAVSGGRWLLIIGTSLEFINVVATFSIAFALWAPLSKIYPSLATAYVGMRALEAMVFLLAMAVPVTLLSLTGGTGQSAAQNESLAAALVLLRNDNIAFLGPLVFAVTALLLYVALYKSRLVPRYIAVWGFVAALGIAGMNIFGLATALKPIVGLPMVLNELWLGIYLLRKGFLPTATPS